LKSVLNGDEIASLFYDASGNLTRRATPTGEVSFVYDGDGMLREVKNEATGDFEVYYYDHTGERAVTYRKKVGQPLSVRQRYGTAEIEYAAGGNVTGTTVDVTLGETPVARVKDGQLASVEYLFNGSVGSLLVATDDNESVMARYGYGPFGEVLYEEGPSSSEYDRLFNGKPRDAISSLRYYGARYYDPLTLTWTQRDPDYGYVPEKGLAEPRRMSPYAFSLNDPLIYVDPDGRDSKDWENNSKGNVRVSIPFETEKGVYQLSENAKFTLFQVQVTANQDLVDGKASGGSAKVKLIQFEGGTQLGDAARLDGVVGGPKADLSYMRGKGGGLNVNLFEIGGKFTYEDGECKLTVKATTGAGLAFSTDKKKPNRMGFFMTIDVSGNPLGCAKEFLAPVSFPEPPQQAKITWESKADEVGMEGDYSAQDESYGPPLGPEPAPKKVQRACKRRRPPPPPPPDRPCKPTRDGTPFGFTRDDL
jgi:RHS repeat-associated protein